MRLPGIQRESNWVPPFPRCNPLFEICRSAPIEATCDKLPRFLTESVIHILLTASLFVRKLKSGLTRQRLVCQNFVMPFSRSNANINQHSVPYGPESSSELLHHWTDKDGRKWIVRLEVGLIGGRLSVFNLSVTPKMPGYPLTQSVIRQLPFADWERAAFITESAKLARLNRPNTAGPHSGRRFSEEELLHVAAVYQTALNARLPVQKTVADELGVPLSTATKRISAARRRGFIAPITKVGTLESNSRT